ncbi:MAG: alpha/beta hydrolase [Deltaproteobacteria bacterium]|nr:alpha/beta hydrolase [Deltaproteobacteria bacterium]
MKPARTKLHAPLLLCFLLAAAACTTPTGEDASAESSSDELVLERCCSNTQPGRTPLVRWDASASYAVTTPKGDAADVYYPTDRWGNVLRWLGVRHPVVVVLQGAQTDKSAYSRLGDIVARHGFVVIVPNHLRALGPGAPPALFTEQSVITDALATVIAENDRQGSPIARSVDPDRLGVVGHSFGGAAALLGVAGTCAPPFCTPGTYTRPTSLKGAVVYGTNYTTQTEPRAALPIDTSFAPVAMIQGTADGRSLPSLGALTYGELEAPKAFIEIAGANHFGITDATAPTGAVPDPSASAIAQNDAVERAATWTAIYLRATVRGERNAKVYIDGAGTADGTVTVRSAR